MSTKIKTNLWSASFLAFIVAITLSITVCSNPAGGSSENTNEDINKGFPITKTFSTGGTSVASPNPANEGDLITITATPAQGYAFKEWIVQAGNVTLSSNTASPATFTMPANAVSIRSEFEALEPDTPNLYFTPASDGNFGSVVYGYEQPAARTITIRNSGTGDATISDWGTAPANFTLTENTGNPTIEIGKEYQITVRPNNSLNAQTYNTTLTLTYDGGRTATLPLSFTVTQAQGANVSGPPTVSATPPTENSITVNTVINPSGNGQSVQYGINTVSNQLPATWQTSTTFTGLTAGTTYYIFARTTADTNYAAGAHQVSTAIRTFQPVTDISSNLPAIIIVGGNHTISGTVTPSNATNQIITWSITTGDSFASIEGNVLTANTEGTVVVTATITNGASPASNFTKTFNITVTTPVISITTHPAAATTVGQGSISGSLSVTANVTGGIPLTYQWFSNTSAEYGGQEINGATGSTFNIPTNLTVAGSPYYFYVTVSAEGAIPLASNVATVNVISNTVNIGNAAYDSNPATAISNAINEILQVLDTVYVTGTRTSPAVEGTITLNIPEGKTVSWTATITGSTRNGAQTQLINLSGVGTFAVSSGTITANGANGCAISNSAAGLIDISGNAVISSASTGNISTATIQLLDRGARLNMTGGTVRVTSSNENSRAIFNRDSISDNAINISGGLVGSMSAISVLGGVLDSRYGIAILSSAAGLITISGGTTRIISHGVAIQLDSNARLNIIGGTVSTDSDYGTGRAINNNTGGDVTISGGLVGAVQGWANNEVNGSAIRHSSPNGILTISGGLITSRGTGGTILLEGTARMTMTGGTVRNIGNPNGGGWAWQAIRTESTHTDAVQISGGTVGIINPDTVNSAGVAIWNANTGGIRISETNPGISTLITSSDIFNFGTIRLDHATGGTLTIEGGTVRNTNSGQAITVNGTTSNRVNITSPPAVIVPTFVP